MSFHVASWPGADVAKTIPLRPGAGICGHVARTGKPLIVNDPGEQVPNLIIRDVQMPKLHGFEVFAKLRADEKLKSVPVITLTGVAEKTGINFSAGAMGDYLGGQPGWGQ